MASKYTKKKYWQDSVNSFYLWMKIKFGYKVWINFEKPWFKASDSLNDINGIPTRLWFQVFLSSTNNFHTIVWFQVFQSDTPDLYIII